MKSKNKNLRIKHRAKALLPGFGDRFLGMKSKG